MYELQKVKIGSKNVFPIQRSETILSNKFAYFLFSISDEKKKQLLSFKL